MPITIPDGLYQLAVPASDTLGGGSPVDFPGTPWYSALADSTDATVIQSVDSFTIEYRFECPLAAVSDPLYNTNHWVRVRAQKGSGATNQALLMDLRQGGVSLHSWSITLSTTLATYQEDLDASVVAAITGGGYAGGLSLRGTTQLPGGLTANRVIVAQAHLGVPPVGFAHAVPSSTGIGWDVQPIASGTYARFVSGGPGVEIVTGIEQAGAIISYDGAGFTVKS